MKRCLSVFLIALSLIALGDNAPKYVFLFIGDGMSTPQRMIAEEFALKTQNRKLQMNHFPVQATTRTASKSSLVTDSAAAATAIACGEKTANGRVGMSASSKRRLESVAEVAHQAGRKVGIVTSVTMDHATPAGFYAHRASRGDAYGIGLDLVASQFEYFGGGNITNPDNPNHAEYRGNIFDLAKAAGYTITKTKGELDALKPGCGKVLARGAKGSLPYSLDSADFDMPLDYFVRKGIELLDNPNGFFMMVEGGAIDWVGHANDAATNLNELLALDKAVQVAIDFMAAHPNDTLIIVTGDHETGGMTMGYAGTGYALYTERLLNQKCSIGKFSNIFAKECKAHPNMTYDESKKYLTEYFGLRFEGDKNDPMTVTDKEEATLKKAFKENKLPETVRVLMSHKAGIGWTTGAHTALPVLTTSTGKCSEVFSGFMENCDISIRLKKLYRP